MSTANHNHRLFNIRVEHFTTDERVALAYKRARLLLQKHGLTANDVLHYTPKFWELQRDPSIPLDIGCYTILAAHVGLTIGTIARYAEYRDDLQPLVDKLLRFDTVGVYLLTERGHGLDAFNLETTATSNEHGFILHTPREEAAKFMPATTPSFGYPKVAVVMARLVVANQDRGVRAFIVAICNERKMCRGVTSTRLPPRSGASPLDFAITTFDHVQLPHSALLGASLEAPRDPLKAWWDVMWRIPFGTGAVAAPFITAIKHTAYIGLRYSIHRLIVGKGTAPVPIFTFRTQQWPMLQSLAVALVLDNWYTLLIKDIVNSGIDARVRHGLSIIVKATACRWLQLCVRDVSERCGAQGTFEYNFMARIEADNHSVIIAEGDVLALSIRLFAELLQGKYTVPAPSDAQTLLWSHAMALMDQNRQILKGLPGGVHGDAANALVIPQAELVTTSFGHALAYSAAVEAGLPQPIIDLFECASMRLHSIWYAESAGISSLVQRRREDSAVTNMLPGVEKYLALLHIEGYVTAPIVTDELWKEYLGSLAVFRGDATSESVMPVDGQPPRLAARL